MREMRRIAILSEIPGESTKSGGNSTYPLCSEQCIHSVHRSIIVPPAIIFSDSATRDPKNGKLTLKGVFYCFKTGSLPFASPKCFATLLIANLKGKIKDLPVTMNIEDLRVNILSSVITRLNSIQEVSVSQVANIAFPFPTTIFKSEGQYKAVPIIDGERIG
jgi:hypothetical protein